MQNVLNNLDAATKLLILVQEETHDSDIYDVLDMISNFREQYIIDNGQFGVGA